MTPIYSHSIKTPSPHPASTDLETVVCDFCGSPEVKHLADLPPLDAILLPMHRLGTAALQIKPEQIGFVECRRCGLVYMNPRLTENAIERFYDAVYAAGSSVAFESSQDKRSAYMLDTLARFLPTGTPHVLDIGCGAGQLLAAAQHRGWQISGSELSGVAVARASEQLGVPIFHGDFRDMGLAPGSVDAVIMQSVVEHLRAPIDFLRDSSALLKPGGVLMFNVPNPASWEAWWARLTGQMWRGFIVEHLYYFTPTIVQAILADLNLEIMHMSAWIPGTRLPNPIRDIRQMLAPAPTPAAPPPDSSSGAPPAIPPLRPVSLPRRIIRQANHYALDVVSYLGMRYGKPRAGNGVFVWARRL
jgi:SAM-dependent methyltransferase